MWTGGRTARKDGHGEANGRFSRRCERVYNGDGTPHKWTKKTNCTHFVKKTAPVLMFRIFMDTQVRYTAIKTRTFS